MAKLLLLDNPRRKRRTKKRRATKRRKLTAKQKIYFGSARTNARPKRRRKRVVRTKSITHFIGATMKHRKHRKHRRSNPPFGGMVSGIGTKVKTSLIGAAGIAANKFISGQIASLVKVDAKNKGLVELASALFILPLVAKVAKVPALSTAATIAGSVAVFDAAKQFLPDSITSSLAGDYNTRSYRISQTPERPLLIPSFDTSRPFPQFNY